MFASRIGAAASFVVVAACSGGGGGGGGLSGNGNAQFGTLQLLGHEPAAAAVQVPLDAGIVLRFDAPMVLDCLQDQDTWLRVRGDAANVAGSFRLAEAGRTVVFAPAQPLRAETDYEFQLSPLTCDQDGRILEHAARFDFRTFDDRAPAVTGANVAPGETGRSRTAPLLVELSEAISAASVTASTAVLRDAFGHRYPCRQQVDGATLTLTPWADLPGGRAFTLQLAASVADRAGNPIGAVWSRAFTTAMDVESPTVLDVWPRNGSTGVSPLVEPTFAFSEAMDPLTVEPASLAFQDQYGSMVAFAVFASPDQRTLRVRPAAPLQPHRSYVLAFLVSGAAVTDVSGNQLAASQALAFSTGDDATPPRIAAQLPAAGESRVSVNATPTLVFDEPLDPAWVGADTVALLSGAEPVPAVVELLDAVTVRLSPLLPLDPDREHHLALRGGHSGLRDRAGNLLPADLASTFTTARDGRLPSAMLQPPDGAAAMAPGVRPSIVFDQPLDPTTVSTATCQLRDAAGVPLAATVSLLQGNRVVTIVPAAPLQPGAAYDTVVRGGADGIRTEAGNWLGADLRGRFRVGAASDPSPPLVTATVNGLDPGRRAGIALPSFGFTIDVTASDPEFAVDIGSVELLLTGPAPGPAPGELFRTAAVGRTTLQATVLVALALAPGSWTLEVRVADLSGNVGSAVPFAFTVVQPNAVTLPFERTQVVWVRTDLDRSANGRPDFDDDLLRLGFATAGDLHGTLLPMRRLLLDAILARANSLLDRGPQGQPLDPQSVPIRLVAREPIGLPHMQMALGGLDPQGSRTRGFGAPSTGVLGRAYYDYRNTHVTDRNIGTSPGLGVFPAEMWLYQTGLHQQLYPSFVTMFARRFLPLCADMGGTPVGSHPDDATILAPGFDPGAASTEQRARWTVILAAVDDWAAVIGTVLVHEIGHGVGLVAPGPTPSGLFGDSSLHNANAGAAEIMAPVVGYEGMILLPYSFRDLDLAYLRQRMVLR